ncbi:hypothetical protein L2E82_33567 [Cichorium intybus]|uniref:Uncharacterized protein n=1 Tax=Cichorium intybus TaxID=13427 RepID=A0ACB9BKS7_CICIN|nr:hypothetical protein L2E82_33567 [Cichorium intybus]
MFDKLCIVYYNLDIAGTSPTPLPNPDASFLFANYVFHLQHLRTPMKIIDYNIFNGVGVVRLAGYVGDVVGRMCGVGKRHE